MWGERAAALVAVALARRGDLSGAGVEEIGKEFSMESLARRASAGDGSEDGRACAAYMRSLPGFPSLELGPGGRDPVIPEATRDQHGYVQMQIARGGVLRSICDSIKDVSARREVPDGFYDQCAEDMEKARRVLDHADEIEAACKRVDAGAAPRRL